MQNKITGLEYCFGKALEIIRIQYPDATEDCFAWRVEQLTFKFVTKGDI